MQNFFRIQQNHSKSWTFKIKLLHLTKKLAVKWNSEWVTWNRPTLMRIVTAHTLVHYAVAQVSGVKFSLLLFSIFVFSNFMKPIRQSVDSARLSAVISFQTLISFGNKICHGFRMINLNQVLLPPKNNNISHCLQ